jgi:hypothetical protein
VFRGILFAFIYVFALPGVVTIFVLMAAALNLRHGSLNSMPFPDGYWKNLLSFAFRLSLIPGIVYLASRGLNRLQHRRSEKRLTLVIASLMLFSVLIVMPPKPPPRASRPPESNQSLNRSKRSSTERTIERQAQWTKNAL